MALLTTGSPERSRLFLDCVSLGSLTLLLWVLFAHLLHAGCLGLVSKLPSPRQPPVCMDMDTQIHDLRLLVRGLPPRPLSGITDPWICVLLLRGWSLAHPAPHMQSSAKCPPPRAVLFPAPYSAVHPGAQPGTFGFSGLWKPVLGTLTLIGVPFTL